MRAALYKNNFTLQITEFCILIYMFEFFNLYAFIIYIKIPKKPRDMSSRVSA